MSAAGRAALVRALVPAALDAAAADRLLAAALQSSSLRSTPVPSHSRLCVVAAGKCAWPMLHALAGSGLAPISRGLVVAPHAETTALPVQVFTGGHPEPTGGSVGAGRAGLELARALVPGDRLFVLMSGGASALLAFPAPPVTLTDKVELTRWLLASGVSIDRLNVVRKHVSLIKGGKLAAATRATVQTFALSDVVVPRDDDPGTIGSGPTVPDRSTARAAVEVLDAVDVAWPQRFPRVAARLRREEADPIAAVHESRLSPAPTFDVVGNRHVAARAAAERARAGLRDGTVIHLVADAVTGEARDAAARLIDCAVTRARDEQAPCCLIASGETTVRVRGRGAGGRNQELTLAAALEIDRRGISATVASIGTDGVDGPTPAAGAIADETTTERARARGLDPERALADNDSHTFFSSLGDTIVTGRTKTNVGDLMLVLIETSE